MIRSGLARRGNAFPRFLASQAMAGALSAELEAKLQNPIVFQWVTGGAGQPPMRLTLHGYDVALVMTRDVAATSTARGAYLTVPHRKHPPLPKTSSAR